MGPYCCEQCRGRTDNDNHVCDLCQAEIDAGIPGTDDPDQRDEDEANYQRMIGESLRRQP